MLTLMILRNFISLRGFTVYMENSLQFKVSKFEIFTEMSSILPEVMRMLIMKLLYTKVKSQADLSSLWSHLNVLINYKEV